MAITIPTDEKQLERLTATVDGKRQEFVLTDKAVYYEGQRSPLTTGVNALVLSLATILGLGLFYSYLRGGRLFVRHSLERIDAVTTRRLPLPSIAYPPLSMIGMSASSRWVCSAAPGDMAGSTTVVKPIFA